MFCCVTMKSLTAAEARSSGCRVVIRQRLRARNRIVAVTAVDEVAAEPAEDDVVEAGARMVPTVRSRSSTRNAASSTDFTNVPDKLIRSIRMVGGAS